MDKLKKFWEKHGNDILIGTLCAECLLIGAGTTYLVMKNSYTPLKGFVHMDDNGQLWFNAWEKAKPMMTSFKAEEIAEAFAKYKADLEALAAAA